MKQKLLAAGVMFFFSSIAVAAGMGAGMSAADKAAMHNKMSTMSATDKAAMRSSMGAGNMGGAGMNHSAGAMGKGAAAGTGAMGAQGMKGTPNHNHTGAQQGAMQNNPAATPPAQAQ